MVMPWRMITGAEPGAVKAASPVLNGGDEETCMWQRALSLSNCLAPTFSRSSGPAFGVKPGQCTASAKTSAAVILEPYGGQTLYLDSNTSRVGRDESDALSSGSVPGALYGCCWLCRSSSEGPCGVFHAGLPASRDLPVQHTEGHVVVSVNPAVPPERLAAVFGVTGSPPLVLPLLLPLELVIQYQGIQPLRLSEAGIALELPDGSQSRPVPITAVAHEVATRYTVVPQGRATPPEALRPGEAIFLALLGVGGLLGEQRARTHAEAEQATAYRSTALQEVVLTQGDAVSGLVFFTSPAARGFREATLLLQFVEATATPAIVIRLPLHGWGAAGGWADCEGQP